MPNLLLRHKVGRSSVVYCNLTLIRCIGKFPGNIDLLWKFFGPNVYMGDGFAQVFEEKGATFSLTILGEYRMVTRSPQNMKKILATEFESFERVCHDFQSII